MKDVLVSIISALTTSGVIGFLFWAYITTKFENMKELIIRNDKRIREIERNANEYIQRKDYSTSRKEDKDAFAEQLRELKAEIRDMPERIAMILKSFITK